MALGNLVQLTGGAFQHIDGSPIAYGRLDIQLLASETNSTNQITTQKVSVYLDANGNLAGTVLIFPTDVMLPS
jgi:hypothetical protein